MFPIDSSVSRTTYSIAIAPNAFRDGDREAVMFSIAKGKIHYRTITFQAASMVCKHAIFPTSGSMMKRAATEGIAGLYSIGRNGEFSHMLVEDVYWRTQKKMHEMRAYLTQMQKNPAALHVA
ncbi:hypothetical protein [Altericista sp. CCNU0014]|uniref:hypothetical protein n=1 Tax=Altericista sp. CCNU0014 TaxID=3082949 RepID=UPI0038514400